MTERILSLRDMDYLRKLRDSRWRVRAKLSVRVSATPKRLRVEASVLAHAYLDPNRTFVVYRRQMLELLHWRKPAFDQLALELPMLMGFRAKEVTTWRAEYIDWQNGDTLVLDAKKHKLCTVPLNSDVARHAMEVLGNREEGYVLQSRSNRQRDPERPLTPIAVWYIWRKWTRGACPSYAEEISPVVGRRLFAYLFYHSQPEDLVELQVIMRHSDPEITLRYVRSLVSWEDVKQAYDRFQSRLREEAPMGVTA